MTLRIRLRLQEAEVGRSVCLPRIGPFRPSCCSIKRPKVNQPIFSMIHQLLSGVAAWHSNLPCRHESTYSGDNLPALLKVKSKVFALAKQIQPRQTCQLSGMRRRKQLVPVVNLQNESQSSSPCRSDRPAAGSHLQHQHPSSFMCSTNTSSKHRFCGIDNASADAAASDSIWRGKTASGSGCGTTVSGGRQWLYAAQLFSKST